MDGLCSRPRREEAAMEPLEGEAKEMMERRLANEIIISTCHTEVLLSSCALVTELQVASHGVSAPAFSRPSLGQGEIVKLAVDQRPVTQIVDFAALLLDARCHHLHVGDERGVQRNAQLDRHTIHDITQFDALHNGLVKRGDYHALKASLLLVRHPV